MKIKLTILLLLFPVILFSQDKWIGVDKALHFTYSALGTALITNTLNDYNVNHSEIKGVAIMFGIGCAKEFMYDSKPSYKDLTADILGCIAGTYVNRWFNKWETKMFYSKDSRRTKI